jgi:cytochrome c551/c552
MTHRRIFAKTYQLLLVFFVLLFTLKGKAQDGAALFSANCATCHAVYKDVVGPALAGVEDRWISGSSKEMLYRWIKNWKDAAQVAKDPYAVKMAASKPSDMNQFSNLKDKDIDAILGYISSVKPPVAPTGPGTDPNEAAKSSDNSLLYGILTLVLGIIALTLLYVNSNLRKISEEKEGIPSAEPIPFYRNKSYLLMTALVGFVLGGYFVARGATGLGRSKNYQPEQPIYYSHKVHAGLNQINCLYCHAGAQEGKQATLPSVNVCMNCHMNIKEYTGPKLLREDGSEVNGTGEIKKLHEYAGYDAATGYWDPKSAKANSIPWVKLHNLPDHVYFNHSQHVKVGQVDCQKCHGEIQEMGEVKQFSDLSMGWCINCHRETAVNFTVDSAGASNGNGFYKQYTRFHDDMMKGKKDKLTVENIGGTECQKCHY